MAKNEAYIYVPEDVQLPALYETEDVPEEEKMLHLKFFTPDDNWTWYVAEYDPEKRLFFGYVEGDFPEWGYFSLDELKSVRGPLGLPVERDLYFKPTKFKDLFKY